MNWKAVLCALCVSVSVAGCGGGGGGSTSGISNPSTAVDQVRKRDQDLNNTAVRGDVNALMSFYSDGFQSKDGTRKADARQIYEEFYSLIDVLRLDTLASQFTVNDNGTIVSHVYSARMVARGKDNGNQATFDFTGNDEWVNEKGTWRIIYSESFGITQIRDTLSRKPQL